jgi:hypothetical protein
MLVDTSESFAMIGHIDVATLAITSRPTASALKAMQVSQLGTMRIHDTRKAH